MLNKDDYLMDCPINLWSAILDQRDKYRDRKCAPIGSASDKDVQALAFNSRFHMTELSVQAIKGGWLIRVFPCDADDGVELFVPHDGSPCEIRKDLIGITEYHHPTYQYLRKTSNEVS